MADADDPFYVAVSRDVGESRLTLRWALRNLPVKKLHLLHVLQQICISPTSSGLQQSEIDAIHESELTNSYDSLHKYRDICVDEGVSEQDVDILCDLASKVEEGIVDLIYVNNIKKLVMGAAADSAFSGGMVNVISRKAEYVSSHAPHCCKIWLVCNGNLIQTREGRFDLVGSSPSSSESLTSLHGLDSALIPSEGSGGAVDDTTLLSPENRAGRGFETMYYEEQRRRLETEELKREKEQQDKMKHEKEEAPSSSFGVSQILYNEEVSRRREAEEELNRAKAEIKNMKRVQKELEEQLYADYPRLLEEVEKLEKERDEAVKTKGEAEELLRLLNLEKGDSSSHSPSSPLQWSVSNEPPPYFFCPISKEIMQNPHVAADGYTYEADEFRRWLTHGGEKSPMTNLRLENHNLTPNLVLRSAIKNWSEQNP